VWQQREYPKDNKCRDRAVKGKHKHALIVKDVETKSWDWGTTTIESFTMQKGQELTVIVELDYASRPEMAKDFSVVAWGHNGN
jgi:hypothetical protein